MTSSATVEQLISLSSSIIGNLSEIMSIATDRLQVTFSSATKRQATSIIQVVVKAGDGPSSSAVVLEFLEKDSDAFTILVAEAGVASVSAVPLTSEYLVLPILSK
jgi:predicted Mrr-cat superfamily restriction endonuclease